MFKCINNLAPEYLCSMFNSINENCSYGLRSATSNNLQVPRPKSEYFKRTFLYSGTNIWNSLPSNIKSLNSEICFKTIGKYYLLRFQIDECPTSKISCTVISVYVPMNFSVLFFVVVIVAIFFFFFLSN